MSDRPNAVNATPHSTKPLAEEADMLAEDPLLDRMVRLPDEDDFADVLSPEGESGDIVGSDISGSTTVSDASIGGMG